MSIQIGANASNFLPGVKTGTQKIETDVPIFEVSGVEEPEGVKSGKLVPDPGFQMPNPIPGIAEKIDTEVPTPGIMPIILEPESPTSGLLPGILDPEDEKPEEAVPEEENPETEVPEDEKPEEAVPEEETPEIEVPEDENPEETVPEEETPETVVPEDEATDTTGDGVAISISEDIEDIGITDPNVVSIMDSDGNGKVSLTEFLSTMLKFFGINSDINIDDNTGKVPDGGDTDVNGTDEPAAEGASTDDTQPKSVNENTKERIKAERKEKLNEDESAVYAKYEKYLEDVENGKNIDINDFVNDLTNDELADFLSAYDYVNEEDGGMEAFVSDLFDQHRFKNDSAMKNIQRIADLLPASDKYDILDYYEKNYDLPATGYFALLLGIKTGVNIDIFEPVISHNNTTPLYNDSIINKLK